jgi:hypothetical protein
MLDAEERGEGACRIDRSNFGDAIGRDTDWTLTA